MQLLPWPNLCRACRARHARGREVHKVLAEAGRAAGAVAAARPVLADRCAASRHSGLSCALPWLQTQRQVHEMHIWC